MLAAKFFGDTAFDVLLDGELAGRAGDAVRFGALVFLGVGIFV